MHDYRKYGPWAIVAGGSEGIGYAFAERLAEAGINLILLARRIQPLSEAKRELLRRHGNVDIEIYSIDLTDVRLEGYLADIVRNKAVGLLVYNAGATSGVDLFLDDSIDKISQLIDLNCHGPAILCHFLAGSMVERGQGGIIILGSMSGLAGSAYNATYSAVKAFEIVFAEGLWAELGPLGVDVLCLIAGKTDTPSLARSTSTIESEDASDSMSAEAVADEGLRNIANGPVHIAGDANRAAGEFLQADRGQAIEVLSAATAAMYSRPYPIQGHNR